MKVAILSDSDIQIENYITQNPFHSVVPRTLDKRDNIVEYDMFITDMAEFTVENLNWLQENQGDIKSRIKSGGLLLVFLNNDSCFEFHNYRYYKYFFVPGLENEISLTIRKIGGIITTITPNTSVISDDQLDSFKKISKLSYSDFSLTCLSPNYRELFSDPSGRPLGLLNQYGAGRIYLLPPTKDRDEVIRIFVKDILPKLHVNFSLDITEENATEEWYSSLVKSIPNIASINQKIDVCHNEIKKLEGDIIQYNLQREEKEKWAHLVRKHDKILEKRIGEAFEYLFDLNANEWQHEPKGNDGPDVVINKEGYKFVIEANGCTGVVLDKKANQLLKWSIDTDYHEHRPLLIGNPFREKELSERPTKPEELFAHSIFNTAKLKHFGVLSTVSLFNLVTKKLKGDVLDIKEIQNQLMNTNGYISF